MFKRWFPDYSSKERRPLKGIKVIVMAYSHCTRMGQEQVQGAGPAQSETMDPGSFPGLRPV